MKNKRKQSPMYHDTADDFPTDDLDAATTDMQSAATRAVDDETARTQYRLVQSIHAAATPLEHSVADFWQPATPLNEIPLPPVHDDEHHAVLKRLGPSPFPPGGFPLIGFLASAYERVSTYARERTEDTQ